jgi:hypothetical protein
MRLYEKQDDQGYRRRPRRVPPKQMRAWKHRVERRRAKQDPECQPCYGKYQGWVL